MSQQEDWRKARVKKMFEDKGFGFVTLEDDRTDAFLHVSIVDPFDRPQVQPGTDVEVLVAKDKKGLRVMKLRL